MVSGDDTRPHLPISVIGRTFALLNAFSEATPELTLTELSERTGLPTSTVHRIIVELEQWGALERDGFRMRPGTRLFELGCLARPGAMLREAGLPIMQNLHAATHQIVHLAVLDGVDVVYIERFAEPTASFFPVRIGRRIPAHCTAVGKAMLAYLPPECRRSIVAGSLVACTPRSITDRKQLQGELFEVVERGIAYDREEGQLGIGCIAAPVLDACRRPLGGLSVTGPFDELDFTHLTPLVRGAAYLVSRALGMLQPANSLNE